MLKLRKGLIIPPTFQADRKDERKVTWLELFYDLTFVVAINQLATFLYDHKGIDGVFKFIGLFIPVWWAWVGQTFYLTRFDSDDLVHRLMTMVQMFAVACMSLYIPSADSDGSIGFALSYFVIRTILVFEYFRAGKAIEKARPLIKIYGMGFSLAAILWLVSIWVPEQFRFWIWGVALVIDYLTPVAAGKLQMIIPPHVKHLPERFGLFTIIVIGESVLSIIIGLDKSGLRLPSLITAMFAWIAVFAVWWSYFDGVRAAEARSVLDGNSSRTYRIWLYSHLPMMMAIVTFAIGFKRVMVTDPLLLMKPSEVWILCGATFVAMGAMALIFRTTPVSVCTEAVKRFLFPHTIVTFLALGVGFCAPFLGGIGIVALISALWVTHVVLSLRESSNMFHAEHQLDLD